MDYHVVWKVSWTHSEYGGNHWPSEPTYHATSEEAYAYKDRREKAWPPDNPDNEFYYSGSVSMESVSNSAYKRINFTR